MVTFDNSFLEKPEWVRSLLGSGMNIARINCAHDNEVLWLKLIELLHEASQDTGIPCKLYMDLAGPKIRVKLYQCDLYNMPIFYKSYMPMVSNK